MNAPHSISLQATVFDHPEFDDHEQIVFCRDADAGLRAIIALHSTARGPAGGGCRFWPYANGSEALTDVLRLSRGMTYKNALADLSLGGGKAVIIGDPRKIKTDTLLEAFACHVERLGGRYVTAEDVGTTAADMEVMRRRTDYALGTKSSGLGDPSPYTALGVFVGIRAAARHVFGSDDLTGLKVCVLGLGSVGYRVAEMLTEAGARLLVSDIRDEAVEKAVRALDARAIPVAGAHRADVNILVPCALGGGLNSVTIPEIRAKIVAGAANNQLATPRDDWDLMNKGILYAPDYAINAGGVISVAESRPGMADAAVRAKIDRIGETLTTIFKLSKAEGRPTGEIADRLARQKLQPTDRAA